MYIEIYMCLENDPENCMVRDKNMFTRSLEIPGFHTRLTAGLRGCKGSGAMRSLTGVILEH